MKANKLFIIILPSIVFPFAAATTILLKLSADRDPEISDSVKKEILKSFESFQVPKLRIQSVEVQMQTEFQGKKDIPKIEVYHFNSVDSLYVLKEGQDREKELSLLGFFQLWQRLDFPNSGLQMRVLEEVSLPSLDSLE